MTARLARCARLAIAALWIAPVASSSFANTPQAEIRSFLGEPLDVRIDAGRLDQVSAEGECFALVPDAIAPAGLDLKLTVLELKGRRTLRLQTGAPVAAPRLQLSWTSGCVPATRAVHAIEVTLSERAIAAAAMPHTPNHGAADPKRHADPGVSVVARTGDSLALLGRLMYPADAARQAQFVAALRAHNPPLSTLAADAAIAPGTPIVFPDLRDLSGIAPVQTLGERSVRAALPAKRVVASAPVRAETPAAPAGHRPADPQPALPADIKDPLPAKATPAPSAAPSRDRGIPGGPAARQGLRLSAPEVDLSRVAQVSPEQRAALRQRRLLLDADDQMAAVLSLQHAVKQLETRLQTLAREPRGDHASAGRQAMPDGPATLKPSLSVKAPPAAPTVAPPAAPPAASPAASPASPAAPPTAAAALPPAKPTVAHESAGTTPVEKPMSRDTAPETVKPRAQPSAPGAAVPAGASQTVAPAGEREWHAEPVWQGTLLAVLAGLAGAWWWSRRTKVPRPASPAPVRDDMRDGPTPAASKREAAPVDAEADPGPATEAPVMEATMRMDAAPMPAPMQSSADADDDSPARFDLDPTPAASLDLALDDRPDEDRVRRLQYMYERFPELMSRTVSIDDADSVINAARLYYEEGHADRACELLTFGIEERPQEVRFWLAQFEIFRLESRADEFSVLATKFHVLFNYAPSWPKVRHIGHELDPSNPLFAAGRDVLATDAHFDPVVENWLNAPMDFTADALMSDLRRDLFDLFNVDKSDFDTLPARLATPR
ncbi:MAG: hypothetical protein JNK75_04525 [Betaproteobacteria bacterium]|nr:hypothetical protein [Betaproteobacteria bacterium]